jgi:cytochrome oxidase Cu insertion factor (SCO1/SenC/PrrC family)
MTIVRTAVMTTAFMALLTLASPVAAVDVGQEPPDFELTSTQGGKLKLSSLKGKNVLINFYTLDFSPA